MAELSKSASPAARLAQEWRERVAKIARNLTDFNDSEACVRVKARMADPARGYTGRSLAAARDALNALDALWQDYLMLSHVVDDADALARRSSLLANHDAEIVALLTGPSIKLPSVSVPVQNRGLLDNPEWQGKLAPAQVLDSMIKAFDLARGSVNQIDTAAGSLAARLAALRAAGQDARGWLLAQGLSVGETPEPAFDAIECDPLGALDRLSEAEAAVGRLVSQKNELAAQRASLDRGLDAAQTALNDLTTLIGEARRSAEGCAARFEAANIACDPGLDAALATLGTWLQSLQSTRSAARAKAGLIGLGKWNDACAAAAAKARGIVEAVGRLAAEQEDIVGRLGALRAKGRSLQATRSAPASLLALEDQARAEARRAPFRAAQSRALVKAYEEALAAFARAG